MSQKITRRKSNLKQDLLAANEHIEGVHDGDNKSLSLLGNSALTSSQYNNSMRTNMFIAHTGQYVSLSEPSFPKVSFGAENTVGDNSDGYYKVNSDKIVYHKVEKFADISDEVNVYTLFLYDKKKDEYTMVERTPCEDQVEIFGYDYDNKVVDSFKVGDKIKKDTVLYKSKSYDDNMNYRYGLDAKVVYTLHPITVEDAGGISESFARKLSGPEIEPIEIGLNHNDYLLNMFGEDIKHYKTLPRIGEEVDGILCVKRTLYKSQILHDFKDSNLSRIIDGDDIIYGTGKVLDYTIYCNNPEIPNNTFNRDLLEILDSQTKYWTEIHETIRTIMNSGSKYSNDIDYMYRRSKEMIDMETMKWKDGDSEFSNVVIHALVERITYSSKGQKYTPRYGNKSVVSRIIPDDEMYFYYDEDGKKVTADIYINLLAIINRTTAYPLYELQQTFMQRRCAAQLKKLKTRKERELFLFEFLYDFDHGWGEESRDIYMKLSEEEKDEYMDFVMYGDDLYENGIFFRDIPFTETEALFHRLNNMYMKYSDWMGPDKVYITQWGRDIPVLNTYRISEMYIMKLKQTSRKNFSVRSMGAINSKSLPERSYKSRSHQEKNSSTPIRFGEYELLTFSIAQETDEHALFHALYRTSVKGRNDLAKIMIDPDLDEGDIDDSYCSRTAEIFNVLLLSLGFDLQFIDEDSILQYVNDDNITNHGIGDSTYMCSDFIAMLIRRIHDIESALLEENPIMDSLELYDLVKAQFDSNDYIIGTDDKKIIDAVFSLYYDGKKEEEDSNIN